MTDQASLRADYDRAGGSLRVGWQVIMETARAQRVQSQVERGVRLSGLLRAKKR